MPSIPALSSLAAVHSTSNRMKSKSFEEIQAMKEREGELFYRWCIETVIFDQKVDFCLPSVIGIGPAKSGSTSLVRV